MIKNYFIFGFLLAVSCTTHRQGAVAPDVQNKPNLSHTLALKRGAQISNPQYDLSLDWTNPSGETYSGQITIRFDLSQNRDPLEIDFFRGTVEALAVNGQVVRYRYDQRNIQIEGGVLNVGPNEVTIDFKQKFSTVNNGLSKFEDPIDHKIYVFTQFEPFEANRAFPSFDQPDLKGQFKLSVKAPRDWTIISAMRESDVVNLESGHRKWQFPATPKISPYLFSFFGGPYVLFEPKKKFRIPLRLFVRATLAKYVAPQEWFDPTIQGLDYFEAYFQTPYAFTKYDQVIVPERSGAMENVGAVAFTEKLLSRGEKSRKEKRRLAEIILHEMAHMWFGDLVTMKWWDDVWLKESFATFAANQALVAATPYKEAWQEFTTWKNSAYKQDESAATHPIMSPTADTADAWSKFDSITYPKGAAVIKQLMVTLGEPIFRQGLANFFKKYAGSNATLDDFFGVMAEASNKSLNHWKNIWLQTQGANTLAHNPVCEGDKMKGVRLLQKPSRQSEVLRPHTFQIAFFESKKDAKGKVQHFKLVHAQSVSVDSADTSIDLTRPVSCSAIVLLNAFDETYAKVEMDRGVTARLLPEVSRLEDSFLRELAWLALWEQVKNGRLNVYEFSYWLAREGLEAESDPIILATLFDIVSGYDENSTGLLAFFPKESAQEKVEYQDQLSKIEDVAWKRLRQAAPGSEQQHIFLSGFIDLAETKLALDNVRSLLSGRVRLEGLKINPDQRWQLIYRLARTGQNDAEDLITAEAKSDPSSQGREAASAARAALPSWVEKKKFLDQMNSEPSPISAAASRRILRSLFPRNQLDLRQAYHDQFFGDLKALQDRNPYLAVSWTHLAPNACEEKMAPLLNRFIQNSKLDPSVEKILKLKLDDGFSCQKVQAFARESSFRPPEIPQVPETRHRRRHRRRH